MAKWCGHVGFVKTVDLGCGVYEPEETARSYFGDVIISVRRWTASEDESTNSDISMNNRISIVADDFAMQNLAFMKWVEYMGAKWSITSVDVAFPRIELSFGSVYAQEEV